MESGRLAGSIRRSGSAFRFGPAGIFPLRDLPRQAEEEAEEQPGEVDLQYVEPAPRAARIGEKIQHAVDRGAVGEEAVVAAGGGVHGERRRDVEL